MLIITNDIRRNELIFAIWTDNNKLKGEEIINQQELKIFSVMKATHNTLYVTEYNWNIFIFW